MSTSNRKLYEGPWELNVKQEGNGKFEISLVRPGNEFGKNSWGWNDDNEKIILFSNSPLMAGMGTSKFQEAIEFANRVLTLFKEVP